MAVIQERSKISKTIIQKIRGQLLDWYDRHQRDLPWRAKTGGAPPDPYHVWLSEVMLQQTTVQAVKPYYTKFLNKWPTIHDLANAPQDEVMAAWAGLGYYARARNLHKCAKTVSIECDGIFPEEQATLKKLPGIGDYTSAAITAIAFNKPATVVDGNVERVMARLFNVQEPLPHSKKHLKALAHELFSRFEARPGDLAQSLMDLGATICIPKAPRCALCPLTAECTAYKNGAPEALPAKVKKKPRPRRHGYVYWVKNEKEEVLFHRRPESGLLGGMLALPTGDWSDIATPPKEIPWLKNLQSCPFKKTSVEHTFTHFDLSLHLMTAVIGDETGLTSGCFWASPHGKGDDMPSLFNKAYKLFLPEGA